MRIIILDVHIIHILQILKSRIKIISLYFLFIIKF